MEGGDRPHSNPESPASNLRLQLIFRPYVIRILLAFRFFPSEPLTKLNPGFVIHLSMLVFVLYPCLPVPIECSNS